MKIVWKPVPGFEGRYEVSNIGAVRSCTRTALKSNGRSQLVRGKVIRPSRSQDGYLRVNLNTPEGPSRYKTLRIHRLVAMVFIPTEDQSQEVNHLNGLRADNRVQNLDWISRYDNMDDMLERNKHRRAVEAICTETGVVHRYPSITAAANALHSRDKRRCLSRAAAKGTEFLGFKWRPALG